MKKLLSYLLISMIVILSICPVQAAGRGRRVQVVPCSGSDVKLAKSGNHLEIYERYDFGSFPGNSYNITNNLTTSVSINASFNILEAFFAIGIDNSYSTSSSIGQTVTNHGNSYSRAALWVSFDDYNVTELNYIGNGACQVYRSTAKVPVYHIYGFENSY